MDRGTDVSLPVVLLVGISALAWVAFALVFRLFWPGGAEPGAPAIVFWSWFLIGVPAFVAVGAGLLRALGVPPEAWPRAALLLSAPALCLDLFTTTFFEAWFGVGGAADDRRYAALVLGGVGVFQLALVALSRRVATPARPA